MVTEESNGGKGIAKFFASCSFKVSHWFKDMPMMPDELSGVPVRNQTIKEYFTI
jgi:hypothetical protein